MSHVERGLGGEVLTESCNNIFPNCRRYMLQLGNILFDLNFKVTNFILLAYGIYE